MVFNMGGQIDDVADLSDKWCILRTSAGRTLPLAKSLAAAGFEVWAPWYVIRVRRPRSHKRVDREVALLPTFVFARAVHAKELARAAVQMLSPHPAFSVFRDRDRVPMVKDSTLAGMRAAEAVARRHQPKPRVAALPAGAHVKTERAGFQGMQGIVETSDDKKTVVHFGGWLTVEIDTFLIEYDQVSITEQTGNGVAALAA